MAMPRAALESLLRERKLDVTLTSVQPWMAEPEGSRVPTGILSIDEPLHGGLRRGQISEIVGPRSSGRTSILCRLFAAATSRGEVVALVDTHDRFDPASAAQAGVDLSRLLWIRERGDAARALKGLNLVLQAGGFGIVAFDLADVPALTIRQFPYTTWMRIARVIEASETTAVVIGAEHITRSPGGVTIALDARNGAARAEWSGGCDRARVLRSIDLHPRVVAART
jgi:recombination protein RecA